MAPEMIGASYSSCVPAGSNDSTAVPAATTPRRRPLESATAVSPTNPSRGPVSPHGLSRKRQGAPQASSITSGIGGSVDPRL